MTQMLQVITEMSIQMQFQYVAMNPTLELERKTRAVLVFATERKNNVYPCLQLQTNVN